MTSAVVLPAAGAASQDDAGTGTDAGNSWEEANLVNASPFQGQLDPDAGDYRDWYRVELPAGKAIRVSMTPDTADFDLFLLNDDGSWLDGSGKWGNKTDVVEAFPQTAAVRFGVVHYSGSGGYHVSFEFIDPVDIRVGDLEVKPQSIRTDYGDVSTGTQRTVQATVENAGPGNGDSVTVVAWAEQDGDYRFLGYERLALPAGETTDVTFTWDATGQVGDAEIHVFAYTPLEMNYEDNVASTTGYAVVGGIGTGVDLLNNGEWVHAWLAGGFVGTQYNEGSFAAYGGAWAPFVYGFAGVGVYGGDFGGGVCARVLLGTCVWV